MTTCDEGKKMGEYGECGEVGEGKRGDTAKVKRSICRSANRPNKQMRGIRWASPVGVVSQPRRLDQFQYPIFRLSCVLHYFLLLSHLLPPLASAVEWLTIFVKLKTIAVGPFSAQANVLIVVT